MRLSVFVVSALPAQLVIDLQKIYAGYLPAESLTEQAISAILQDTSTRLYATMFNERHIGAAKVNINGSKAILSQLTVRDLTRRRGVGKNLLVQIEKLLIAEGIELIEYSLQEVAEKEQLSTQAFLVNSGYSLNGHIAQKRL
jgi:GNAT superfamily N-acetyltransferase